MSDTTPAPAHDRLRWYALALLCVVQFMVVLDIAIVNVADPATPKVIATADTPGPALRVAYSAGHLFVAAWTDARVYDVTNPANPVFLGAVRLTTDVAYPDDAHPPVTARTKGIAAEGNDVFLFRQGRFEEASSRSGAREALFAWSNAVTDLNLDGSLDVVCVNGFVTGDLPHDT